MKAITIRQPWASLIALGEKKIETRSWQTKYRGPILIHAGKSVDKKAMIGLLYKLGIAAQDVMDYYPNHLKKLETRPRD